MYVLEMKTIIIIIDMVRTPLFLWSSISHEKGHADRFPGKGHSDYITRAIVERAIASFRANTSIDSASMLENLVEDCMIHANYIARPLLMESDKCLWTPKDLRYVYETELARYPSNFKDVFIPDYYWFFIMFQTAIAWLYFAYKDEEGSAMRDLFEVRCKKCGQPFLTLNYRCPRPGCLEWNLTEKDVPDIPFLRDEKSIFVTDSKNKRIQRVFELLRVCFLDLLRIDYYSEMYPLGTAKGRNLFLLNVYSDITKNFAEALYSLGMGQPNGLPVEPGLPGWFVSSGDHGVNQAFFPSQIELRRIEMGSKETELMETFRERNGVDFRDAYPDSHLWKPPVYGPHVYWVPDDDMYGDSTMELFRAANSIIASSKSGDVIDNLVMMFMLLPSEEEKHLLMTFLFLHGVGQEVLASIASGGGVQ